MGRGWSSLFWKPDLTSGGVVSGGRREIPVRNLGVGGLATGSGLTAPFRLAELNFSDVCPPHKERTGGF